MAKMLSLADYEAAEKWKALYIKAGLTTAAGTWTSLLKAAGNFPAAVGPLIGSIASGVVNGGWSGVQGFLNLWGEEYGYLSRFEQGVDDLYITKVCAVASVPCSVRFFDIIQSGNTTVDSGTGFDEYFSSYEADILPRLCGTDDTLELWQGRLTGKMTSDVSATITGYYGDDFENDVNISAVMPASLIADAMLPIPLNAGLKRLRRLSYLSGGLSGAGYFDIFMLRHLFSYDIEEPYKPVVINLLQGGGVPIHYKCHLSAAVCVKSGTTTGSHNLEIELAAR